MDLHNVDDYLCPNQLNEVQGWKQDWDWLGGGTWIFSNPQHNLKVLIDLEGLEWTAIESGDAKRLAGSLNLHSQVMPEGLAIGATCTLDQLFHYLHDNFADDGWKIALQKAVSSLASFKVTNVATVGGNLCLALPVGTLAPVMVMLEATYEIWNTIASPRYVAALDFQIGRQQTRLEPGDVLRRIWLPATYYEWYTTFQRMGVTNHDPALSIVVGGLNLRTSAIRFGLGACFSMPRLLEFASIPTVSEMGEALDTQFSLTDFLEDARASGTYRKQITLVLMQRALEELRCQSH